MLSFDSPQSPSSALRFLLRVLENLGEGIRSAELLSGLLEAPPDEIRRAVALGRHLGLVEAESPTRLTRRGLSVAFGKRPRRRVLGRRILTSPFVLSLLAGRGRQVPEIDAIVRFLERGLAEPTPSIREQHRQEAIFLGALLEAALTEEPVRRAPSDNAQLSLGLPQPRPPATSDQKGVSDDESDAPESPRIYRAVLQVLLDEGELSMGHIRAILDDLGAQRAPVGGYAHMAVRRGDASRSTDNFGDKLVVTRSAVERRDLSDTVVSVALSDPEYRAYLDVVRRCVRKDPAAALRYSRLRPQFERWDRCVFGSNARPMDIAEAMDRLLLGQPLDAFPVARPSSNRDSPPFSAPFLDVLNRRDLFIALPPSLEVIAGGLPAVNAVLDERNRRPLRVGQPLVSDPRTRVHGGLFHPGETPARAIPDMLSLRVRVVSRVPHIAFLTALLYLHRRTRGRVKLHLFRDRLSVLLPGRPLGSFLTVADRWMRERGWVVSRRFRGGLTEAAVADIALKLGIADHVGRRLLLGEEFFWRLRENSEERELLTSLQSLVELLENDLPKLYDPPVEAELNHTKPPEA